MRRVFLFIFILAAFAIAPALSRAEVPSELPVDDGVVTIVLDPGHGGDDTGAKGPTGAMEKDVTLAIAIKAAELLRANTDCKVLLTRTTDVFVPLDERTAFANRNNADIFISVHANAALSKVAKGIETFFLNMEASDEDARRLAAFENSSGTAVKIVGEPDDLKEILFDLANTRAHHESSRLAEIIQASMLGDTGKEDRGVKQAPFAVLAGAAMPAVLVEVGFISNPREERALSSKKEQDRIARSITEGVAGFREILTKGKGYIEVSGRVQKD